MERQAKSDQLTNTEKVLYWFGGILFLLAFTSTIFLSSVLTPLAVLQLRLTFVGIALVYFLATHFYGQRLQKLIEKITKKRTQRSVSSELADAEFKDNTEVKTCDEIVFANNNQEKFEELVEGLIDDKISSASVVRIDQKIIKSTVVHYNKDIVEELSTIDVEEVPVKHSTHDIPVENQSKNVISFQSPAALTRQKQSNKKTPKVKTGTEIELGKTSTKVVRNKNDKVTIWFNGSVRGKK